MKFNALHRYLNCHLTQIDKDKPVSVAGKPPFVKMVKTPLGSASSHATRRLLQMNPTSSKAAGRAVTPTMSQSYLETLLGGDRVACREMIEKALASSLQPFDLLTQLVWPTMEMLQSLYREDRIAIASLNLATRLNRMMTDQLCMQLPRGESNGK